MQSPTKKPELPKDQPRTEEKTPVAKPSIQPQIKNAITKTLSNKKSLTKAYFRYKGWNDDDPWAEFEKQGFWCYNVFWGCPEWVYEIHNDFGYEVFDHSKPQDWDADITPV